MYSIRGERGEEATVKPEGTLLSRDKDRMERASALCFIYWEHAQGWGGAARRRSWDGQAGWKFKLFNLSDDCPIKNCQVYYCFS